MQGAERDRSHAQARLQRRAWRGPTLSSPADARPRTRTKPSGRRRQGTCAQFGTLCRSRSWQPRSPLKAKPLPARPRSVEHRACERVAERARSERPAASRRGRPTQPEAGSREGSRLLRRRRLPFGTPAGNARTRPSPLPCQVPQISYQQRCLRGELCPSWPRHLTTTHASADPQDRRRGKLRASLPPR